MDTYVSGLIILLSAVLFYLYYTESMSVGVTEESVKEGFYPGWRRGYWGNYYYNPPYYRHRWWPRYPSLYYTPYPAPYRFW